MVLPGSTLHILRILNTYAILKFSQKGDNRDPLNCWSLYITSSSAFLMHQIQLVFVVMTIRVSVVLLHSCFLPVLSYPMPVLLALTDYIPLRNLTCCSLMVRELPHWKNL